MKKIYYLILLLLLQIQVISAQDSKLIPWPKTISENTETLNLTENSRIVYNNGDLESLANIVKDDIKKYIGLNLTVSSGTANSGDIELDLDNNLLDEEYTLSITNKALIKGKNYKATVWGTSTLLQAMTNNGQIKKLTITDSPDTAYRGLMVDLARNWHTVNDLEAIINLCRFYKINSLQLHLTDDQSFTFTSTAYPNLATPDRSYSLAELNALEAYSQERGVTIIPELDVPGHAKKMVLSYPNLFGIPGRNGNVINFSSTETWAAVGTLINEISDVFQAAPYIHIGGDEVDFSGLGDRQDFRDAINNYNVGDVQGLFNYFINELNDDVRSRDKKTLVWEGFNPGRNGNAKLDANVIVCPFDNYRTANSYASNGHDILNTSWFPLYLIPSTYVPSEKIYNWDITQFGRYASPFPFSHNNVYQYTMNNPNKIIGAQTCSWEQPASLEIPSLRGRLSTMSDRVWNENSGKPFNDYTDRLESTDVILQAILATNVPDKITPSASFNIFDDKIVVRWRAKGQFPSTYTLYRNTTNNNNTATAILSNTTATSYEDNTASSGQRYYYWIKATNSIGTNAFGDSADGRRGTNTLASVYESFDYSTNSNIDNLNGGEGFNGRWDITRTGGSAVIKNNGLTYPNLVTGGKRLNINMNGASDSFVVERSLAGTLCPEGSEVWVSTLIKTNKVGDGHLFIQVGDQVFGKKWGNGVRLGDGTGSINAQLALENGETNFIVIKIEAFNGSDNARIWINPTVDGTKPDSNDPNSYATELIDFGTSPVIKFNNQQYGEGNYDIDEFRIGDTFDDVMPAEDILGINDVSLLDETINIYPNPFNSELFINQKKNTYQEAILYDLSGRIIRKTKIGSQEQLVVSKATQISSGVYILKLIGENHTKSVKVIRK